MRKESRDNRRHSEQTCLTIPLVGLTSSSCTVSSPLTSRYCTPPRDSSPVYTHGQCLCYVLCLNAMLHVDTARCSPALTHTRKRSTAQTHTFKISDARTHLCRMTTLHEQIFVAARMVVSSFVQGQCLVSDLQMCWVRLDCLHLPHPPQWCLCLWIATQRAGCLRAIANNKQEQTTH